MKRKIILFISIVSMLILSSSCFATTYDLTRKEDENGEMHYYMEYSDGSYEEITEDDYYDKKYGNTNETTEPNNTSEMGIITGSASDSQENNNSDSIFAGRTQTTVISSRDVSDENFENTRKISEDNVDHYYVFLKNGYYAEITEDLYYLFTFKYERNTMNADESNAAVHDEYDHTGHVVMKGFVEDDISGYTIYVRVKKYFGNEEYSYFVYDPDYTIEVDLPVGEYYIMNGGLLNDYTYSYPISNPDFVVEEGQTTNLYFTVGKASIPEEYTSVSDNNISQVNDEQQAEEEIIANDANNVNNEQDANNNNIEEPNTALQIIRNIAPTAIAIILLILITVIIIIKRKSNQEDD